MAPVARGRRTIAVMRMIVIMMCLMLGACAGERSADVGVLVTDEADVPIERAAVVMSRSDPQHPLSAVALFGTPDVGSQAWRTDAEGRAVVRVLRGRPQSLSVWARGFVPWCGFIDGPSEGWHIRLPRE